MHFFNNLFFILFYSIFMPLNEPRKMKVNLLELLFFSFNPIALLTKLVDTIQFSFILILSYSTIIFFYSLTLNNFFLLIDILFITITGLIKIRAVFSCRIILKICIRFDMLQVSFYVNLELSSIINLVMGNLWSLVLLFHQMFD